ncbi:hypothetical protein [Veillonella criceti]|uniref:Uncharacterized protein n=1 Tax=Veillonella criceti TaxID=103891 RepID=A0A380NJF9_9FIRM|nr:hypothetical protein [Veillonella criceti]SUP42464.1 Uncharacterised protein [Veillonella criceti]
MGMFLSFLVLIIIIWCIIGMFIPKKVAPFFKFNNRKWIILTSFILVIICVILLPTPNTSTPPKNTNSTTKTTQVAQSIQESSKISSSAGIGATISEFKDDYGAPNRDNHEMKSYDKDNILVIFLNDRAINVTLQKNIESKLPSMIPSDAKELSTQEKSDDLVKTISTLYSSEQLKKVTQKFEKFEVIKQYDIKKNELISIIIGIELPKP